MTSYWSANPASASRSRRSRPVDPASSTSAPASAIADGITSTPGDVPWTTSSARSTPSRRPSYIERSIAARSIPNPLVAFPCGSRSIRRTRSPEMARRLARFTTVVVLPTPPFWFAQAIVRPTQRCARTGFTDTDSTIDGPFTSDAAASARTAEGWSPALIRDLPRC